jgi:putative AdoMet-dependent methyltransferase
MSDSFPVSDFDEWADSYDQDVASGGFPFTGYQETLNTVVQLADARPGMTVLDIGSGTGNLADQFLKLGFRVTAMDYSSKMLENSRNRLPGAALIQADLRHPFPTGLSNQKFDRIVSAYVFHHFDLEEKVTLLERCYQLLTPGGWLVIADVSFADRQEKEAVRQEAGDAYDEEFYWIVSEAIPALTKAGFIVKYQKVSPCAGVYLINLNT